MLVPRPVNPADKSVKLGLTPYHAIAPKLNELQKRSDRFSVEVAGRSAGGHELYLVTVVHRSGRGRTCRPVVRQRPSAGFRPLAGPEERLGRPLDAAGRASVVSGTSAQGSQVVLFGTQPLFRAHRRGCSRNSGERC
ncbi:hypothetical protein ACFCYB_13595 [Streptomyces sp. NPDC056309]|uniref:hypothetical protein n=1 Tax=unclassified Streptomyces TaxID=2593676 RepID=UPI0035DD68AB